MARPTRTVLVSENEINDLQAIIQNNPEDSILYKRAAVILASARGKQGKEIAEQYNLTQNTVIAWRRKFEKDGVKGLMSDAPKPGKSLANDPSIIEKVKVALASKPQNADSWTIRTLARHLELPRPTVQKVLEHLGISLPESTATDEKIALTDQMRAQVIGLYLTQAVQILALVIFPSADTPLFSRGKAHNHIQRFNPESAANNG